MCSHWQILRRPVIPVYFGLILLANDFWTLLLTIAFFILPNALLRVTVVSLTSQRAEMGQGAAMGLSKAIASQLVGKRELFIRYQLRNEVEEAYLDPVADPYPGQVVILVDELSASSSEEFAGSLQALGRATVIGSQTPGRCLVSNIVLLPYDAVLVYPYGQSQTPDGRVLEGNGVVPDIEVALERASLLHGVDRQMEAALASVQDQIGK